jgi:peptidoglycan/LPS O-acetylase OafA/YrhL
MRWDDESRVRVVVGLAALVVGAYVSATTEPTYYLHLPAVWLIVFGVWGLLLAVVPELRGEQGNPHRLLIVVGSWTLVLLIMIVVGRAAVSS